MTLNLKPTYLKLHLQNWHARLASDSASHVHILFRFVLLFFSAHKNTIAKVYLALFVYH